VLKLMLPVTLGIGLINFNLSVNSIFATLISEEAPAAIDKAFRIYMLPQGVFAVALATVLFPTFSRLAARRDLDGLRNVQGTGSRQMLLLLVPAAALMLVLSEPITRIVYQRGEFDAGQTDIVAEALFFFSLSLPFAGVNLIMIRTFFSLQLPWRPTQIALANLGVNAGLDALLYEPMGVGGITLATAIVSFVTTIALAITLRSEIGGVDMARTVNAGIRISVAGVLCAAVALGVREALDGLGGGLVEQTALVAAASAAGLAVYVAVVLATRVDEARQITALVRGQLARLR
jgi:putative peptidoglycan lipid II flippase